jgi:curved DNA-binding protein
MKFIDYYKVLGLERSASLTDIKQAYRKLAHQFHPDVSKDPKGEEKFKAIAEAYATLKDPEKRAEYDKLGTHRSGEEFVPPQDWQDQFDPSGAAFSDVDLADLLAAFTASRKGSGQGAGRAQGSHPRPRDGEDYEVPVTVTLEQVYAGAETEVSVRLPEYDQHGLPHRVPRTFKVRIPKGAADGQRLRLAGKGGQGSNGGKHGDLYIAITLQPHPWYRVKGRDLYLELPLAPWEAVLGATVQVPTLGGMVELKVAAGTTAARQLRLTKRGLPHAKGEPGDLFAVVQIVVPAAPGAAERQLFAQLAADSTFKPRAHFTQGAQA